MTDQPALIPASEMDAEVLAVAADHGQAALDALAAASTDILALPSSPGRNAAIGHLRRASAAVQATMKTLGINDGCPF